MRRRITAFAKLAALLPLILVVISCSTSKVDPGLVGTWELNVPNADGVARWVWDIHSDGTYAFHAEGPGGVPSHSGTFEAKNGKYTLRSTTMVWVDDGTYQLQGNALNAAGKLGRATWNRVMPAPIAAAQDSSGTHADTGGGSGAKAVDGRVGASASAIYEYLSHNAFDERILDAPLKATRTATVDPSEQERRDGVIGIVRTDVEGASSPATISFVVFRDRSSAEAARDIHAMYDSKTFRMKPGEFVSSHAYTYRERGEARCLSRLLIGSSSRATVTCYLLVQYPTRDPVMIESEVSEAVAAKAQEASNAAVEQADDLLFAALKEWAVVYPAIGGGGQR